MKSYRYEICLIDENSGNKNIRIISINRPIEKKQMIVTSIEIHGIRLFDEGNDVSIQIEDQKIKIPYSDLFHLVEACLWFNLEKICEK